MCSQRRTQSSRSSACAWVGTMLVGGRGAGRGFGTGLGCECNSPQHPLCLGAPKGRTEGIKPHKSPTQASKPSKTHSKRICGYFSTTGVKTQTGWSFPLSTQLSIFHMELQLQLCCWRAPLGWKAAGEFSQKFLLIWTNLWVVSIGSRYIFCAAHEQHWSEPHSRTEGKEGLQWAAFPGEQGLIPPSLPTPHPCWSRQWQVRLQKGEECSALVRSQQTRCAKT